MQAHNIIRPRPTVRAICIAILLTAFSQPNSTITTSTLTCTIKSDKTKYKVGELPAIKVDIKNNTGKDIYLIGSLDGSDLQWRMPYCYFTIQKPKPDIIKASRCGNMNPLRKEDFVLVKAGEKFNPYRSFDPYGFFTDYSITNKETFKNPGTYKIRFHYSTTSQDISKFLGDRLISQNKEDSLKIAYLFEQVPRVDLESNEIEISVEE